MDPFRDLDCFIRKRNLLAHVTIWFLIIIVLVLAQTVFEGTLIGIIYLAFFLAFIISYQSSYYFWAKTLRCYIILLIIYSTGITVVTFLDSVKFEKNWLKKLFYDGQIQQIGLDESMSIPYSISALCLIVALVIYLGTFNEDFHRFLYLAEEVDPSLFVPLNDNNNSHLSSQQSSINDTTVIKVEQAVANVQQQPHRPVTKVSSQIKYYLQSIACCCWRIIDIHYPKVVAFMIFRLPIVEVNLINSPFLLLAILAIKYPSISNLCYILASWLISIIIISRNLHKLDQLVTYPFGENILCTNTSGPLNMTYNNYLDYTGLAGTSTSDFIQIDNHLLVLLLITIHTFIIISRGLRVAERYELSFGIVFSGIGRREADSSIIDGLKYYCNFGFYQFGIEITCLTLIIALSYRLDFVASIYGLFLVLLSIITSRNKLRFIWPLLSLLSCTIIIIQYLFRMGLPKALCHEYEWSRYSEDVKVWFYLPDYKESSDTSYLMFYDFFVLLAIHRQALVFYHMRLNSSSSLPTSSNSVHNLEAMQFRAKYLPSSDEFTISDYFASGATPSKFMKICFFTSMYWITLTVVLIAGATNNSLFSLGYLIGCFIFLFLGNDAYLKPRRKLFFCWTLFVLYAALVMMVKVILQLYLCYDHKTLMGDDKSKCWIMQLLRLVCYRKLNPGEETTCAGINDYDRLDIIWDGICLMFLLIQRVVFNSRHFRLLIQEVKAQSILAYRGAELIMATQIEDVKAQAREEKAVMDNIRKKMHYLRSDDEATAKAWERLRSLPYHHQIIRNADRHLFCDSDETTISERGKDSSRLKSEFIPDPMGDELERMAEVSGISAIFTRWMKADTLGQELAIGEGAESPSSRITSTSSNASRSSSARRRRAAATGAASTSARDTVGPILMFESSASLQSYEMRSFEAPDKHHLDTNQQQGDKNGDEDEHDSGGDNGDSSDASDSQGDQPNWFQRALTIMSKICYACLLSGTVRLNKLSRSYRYVSRRLNCEKDVLKREYDLNDTRFKTDPIWRKEVINSLSKDYSEPSHEFDIEKLNMFTQFCRALGYVVISNTELWCYVIIVINQLSTASLLSLPLPLMVFLWGTLSVPRPTKRFWKTVITYTEIIIMIKYICQFPFDFLAWFKIRDTKFSPGNLLGLADASTGSRILLDLLTLLTLFFHRSMLKTLGQWDTSGLQVSTSNSQALPEVETAGEAAISKSPSPSINQATSIELADRNWSYRTYYKIKASIQQFYLSLLKPTHQVPSDNYTLMFICDFINFLILIYGFWAFGIGYKDQTVASFLNENRVPFSVLVMLLLQFGSIMIDRCVYLQKNINGKLWFHVVLVIAIHIWLFFGLSLSTGPALSINLSWPPKAWYIFKCVHFLLSANQVRSGYPRRVLGNCFTKSYGYFNYFAFKLYRAIPLVHDLRLYMDWKWTQTTLEFRNWSIMEDMYAKLFIRKCELTIEEEYARKRAKPIVSWTKDLYAWTFIILILAIIWGPLLLFSMSKTVGDSNPPDEADFELEIVGFQPIIKMRASINETDFINQTMYSKLTREKLNNAIYNDYRVGDVATIRFDGQSNALWQISPSSFTKLTNLLGERNASITFKSSITIYRTKKPRSPNFETSIAGSFISKVNDRSTLDNLKQMLTNQSNIPVVVPKIFPTYIRVPGTGKVTTIEAESMRNITITFINYASRNSTQISEWKAADLCDPKPFPFWDPSEFKQCDDAPLVVVAFSDRIFTGLLALISGPGIIGIYTTFVVFIARLIRAEPSEKVVYTELPNVDKVFDLIMDIYMTRECKDFELEEKLFAKLLFLYRSPELLIDWSRTLPIN